MEASMAGFGMSELLILFAVAGGIADGGDVKLMAPRDTADKAIRYVLPDAEIVVHVNLEAGIGSVFALLDEVAELKAAKESPEVSEAIVSARTKLGQGLKFFGNEVELDLTKDLGSFTFSLSLADQDNMSILVRMRGNFEKSKIQEKITKDSVGTYEMEGETVHRLKDESVFSETVVTFPDSTTLLLGPRAVVDEILKTGRVKPVKGSKTERLKGLVSRKTSAFSLISLPDWAVTELGRDRDLELVAKFLGEVDYIFYGAGSGKGVVEAGTSSKEALKQITYLFKATAGFLDTVRAIVDAGANSILGLVPLVPENDIEPAWQKVLSDEEAVLELATWFKKRFTGKSKVKTNSRKKTVRLELDNPAAMVGALTPVLAGAGYWMFMRPFHDDGPMYETKPEFEPDRKPAIEYIPIP
jgi:hypothetical protein